MGRAAYASDMPLMGRPTFLPYQLDLIRFIQNVFAVLVLMYLKP